MIRPLNMAEERMYKKGVDRKLYAVRIKGNTIYYECKECGGISQKTHKHVGEHGIKKMASWHSKEKGGCRGPSRRCGRKIIEHRYGKNGFRFMFEKAKP